MVIKTVQRMLFHNVRSLHFTQRRSFSNSKWFINAQLRFFQDSKVLNMMLMHSTVFYSLVSSTQLDPSLLSSVNKGEESFVVLDADMVQFVLVPDF